MEHPIKDSLIFLGYDLKGRAKIYTGAAVGGLTPLVVTRYSGCVNYENEALAWIAAAGLSLIPSIVGAFAGLLFGATSADASRIAKIRKERQKQSQLEKSVQDEIGGEK